MIFCESQIVNYNIIINFLPENFSFLHYMTVMYVKLKVGEISVPSLLFMKFLELLKKVVTHLNHRRNDAIK